VKFFDEMSAKQVYHPDSMTPDRKMQILRSALHTHERMMTAIQTWDQTQQMIDLREATHRAAQGLEPLEATAITEEQYEALYQHL
jgi:hypothetical protein